MIIEVYVIAWDTDGSLDVEAFLNEEKAVNALGNGLLNYDDFKDSLGEKVLSTEELKDAWKEWAMGGGTIDSYTYEMIEVEVTESELQQMLKKEVALKRDKPFLGAEGVKATYINYYRHCEQEWEDIWDSMCNDRCPVCNKEIQPYKSEEV